MKKQISKHKYKLNALKIRHIRAYQIMLFERALEFVTLEAFNLVLDHQEKVKKGEILLECDRVFSKTMSLPCGYKCELQQAQEKPFLLSRFNKRQQYIQRTEANEGINIPYELIRNPAIILRKRKRGRQAVSSTRRDPSHWEVEEGRGRGRGRGRGKERGRGRGRGTRGRARGANNIGRGRGKGKVVAPIELSSDDSKASAVLSESSDPTEFEIYVEAAREKRMRMPSLKERENEAARAEAEATKAKAAEEQAEKDFWGLEQLH